MNSPLKEQAFIASVQLQALRQSKSLGRNQSAGLPLSMQSIVDTVLYPNHASAIATRRLINTHLPSRRLLKLVLDNISIEHSKAQAAASSSSQDDLLAHRRGNNFELKLVKDNTSKQDAFLLVTLLNDAELNNPTDTNTLSADKYIKGLFLHCEWQDEFYFQHLEYAKGSRFQSIISLEKELANALCELESQLYLSLPNSQN